MIVAAAEPTVLRISAPPEWANFSETLGTKSGALSAGIGSSTSVLILFAKFTSTLVGVGRMPS